LKLSVIIPVYNVEKWLPACLDSVLQTAGSDYEVIAVNDGSTDASAAVLTDYAARFPALLRVITTPNGGLGHARNTGLEAAAGEYLLFLDSDDTLSPGAVSEMLSALDGSFDVGVFDIEAVDEQGRVLQRRVGCGRQGDFTLEEYPRILTQLPNAVNKLWRRRLFTDSEVRFPDRLWYEDLATTPRLYRMARRFRYLEKPWYRYLQRSGSIMSSGSLARNGEIITALDLVLDDYRTAGLFERFHAELEYLALCHQLLAACDRVAQLDAKNPLLPRLVADYTEKFPHFSKNPYYRSMSAKHKLLIALSLHGHFRAVGALMALNERIKGRK